MIAASFAFITACGAGSKKENHNMGKEKRTQVKLETTMGNITVELYNETPSIAITLSNLPKKVYMTARSSIVLSSNSWCKPVTRPAKRLLIPPCWVTEMWAIPFRPNLFPSSSIIKVYLQQPAKEITWIRRRFIRLSVLYRHGTQIHRTPTAWHGK